MDRREAYIEYAYQPENAWEQVERGVLDYFFKRFLKDRYGFLRDYSHLTNMPHLRTVYGSLLPGNFSVLDLGTGTGRVPQRLIEYGIPPGNILGVDKDLELLTERHYPKDVNKLCNDVSRLSLGNPSFPKKGLAPFNLVTANMVFHTFTYEEYVQCLKSVRQVMRPKSLMLVVIPHPYRRGINSIPEYHQQHVIEETGPWGGRVDYCVKTIQDYLRGMAEAGLRAFQQGETGVGLKVLDKVLASDEVVWSHITSKANGRSIEEYLPDYHRMWWAVYPI